MQFFIRIAALAVAAAPFLANAAPVDSQPLKEVIPGKYIVQLKPDTDVASIAAHHNKVRSIHALNLARRGEDGTNGSPIEREFGFGDFKAYAGSFDEMTIEELKAMPEVLDVEQDFIMSAHAIVTQDNAPWGLGSISSRTPGASSYIYDDSAGDGTFTYIMDSGVRVSHNDFGGRAIWGINTSSGSQAADDNGHGTHVAGSAGGTTYGVAKKTTIIAVKVLAGSTGSASAVFAGFDWTVNDIVSKGRQNTAVINMSLGASASTTWDAAITAAWNKGVLVVTSSGNAESPASGYSPCRSPEAICVGNIESDNKRHGGAGGSNYGPEVDIFAAGTNVLSASYLSDSGSAQQTGTSMASPHVAGLISYIRALEGPMSAADVKARVFELATLNVVTDPKGSVNRLAYNGNNRRSATGSPANSTIEARATWKLW